MDSGWRGFEPPFAYPFCRFINCAIVLVRVRWRHARPGHLWVCGRNNEPYSSSRRLVSRSKTAQG